MAIQLKKAQKIAGMDAPVYAVITGLTPDQEALLVQGGDATPLADAGIAPAFLRFVPPSAIASPTPEMLADRISTFVNSVQPELRYQSTGSALQPVGTGGDAGGGGVDATNTQAQLDAKVAASTLTLRSLYSPSADATKVLYAAAVNVLRELLHDGNLIAKLDANGYAAGLDVPTALRAAGLIDVLPGILNDTAKANPRTATIAQTTFAFDFVAITATAPSTSTTASGANTKVNCANGLSGANVGHYVYVQSWSASGAAGYYRIAAWTSNTDMDITVGVAFDGARGNPTILGPSAANDGFPIITATLKGNTLGKRGYMEFHTRSYQSGTASRKVSIVPGATYSSGAVISDGFSTTAGVNFWGGEIANLGAENVQRVTPTTGATSSGNVETTQRAYDTTVDQSFTVFYGIGAAAVPVRVEHAAAVVHPWET